MKFGFRKGVQFIIYRKMKNRLEFLLMYRSDTSWNHWEIPKGGIEENETYEDAIVRELNEECGIVNKDIIKIKKTFSEFVINYPTDIQEKTGKKGGCYKIFLIELNPKKIIKIQDKEHNKYKWIDANNAENYISGILLESFKKAILILLDYRKMELYSQTLIKIFKKNLKFVSLFGSRLSNDIKNKSDFDILIILKKQGNNDMELISNISNKSDIVTDITLIYENELLSNGKYISNGAATCFFYYVFKNSIDFYGLNPFIKMSEPSSEDLSASVVLNTKYYLDKIRKSLTSNKKIDTSHLLKRFPIIINHLLMLKGIYYDNENDAIEDFNYYFPGIFKIEELKAIKLLKDISYLDAINPKYLYDIYSRIYNSELEFIKNKKTLTDYR